MRLKLVPIDLDGSRSFPSISEIGYLFSVIELDRIDDLTSIDVRSSAFTAHGDFLFLLREFPQDNDVL